MTRSHGAIDSQRMDRHDGICICGYVHGITEFGENEPSVQKSVFKRLRVEHCTYYKVVVRNFLSVPSVTHRYMFSHGYYIHT